MNSVTVTTLLLWFLTSSGIIKLFSPVLGVECSESHSCAFTSLNYTDGIIYCRGYKSCFGSPIINANYGGDVYCFGSYSCSNSTLIETKRTYGLIYCGGYKSCANVNHMIVPNNHGGTTRTAVLCGGELSCINSKITIINGGQIDCFGKLSCINSIVTISYVDDFVNLIQSSLTNFDSFSFEVLLLRNFNLIGLELNEVGPHLTRL